VGYMGSFFFFFFEGRHGGTRGSFLFLYFFPGYKGVKRGFFPPFSSSLGGDGSRDERNITASLPLLKWLVSPFFSSLGWNEDGIERGCLRVEILPFFYSAGREGAYLSLLSHHRLKGTPIPPSRFSPPSPADRVEGAGAPPLFSLPSWRNSPLSSSPSPPPRIRVFLPSFVGRPSG